MAYRRPRKRTAGHWREVLFEVPEPELEDAARIASHAMRHAFELEVPLVVGVEAGHNWADLSHVSFAGDAP